MALASSLITVPAIIRIWVSLILIYLVRSWSSMRHLSMPREIMLYIVVFAIAWMIDTFIWPTRVEMGREESDLVQEYLRHRNEGETMGQYLIRLEKEEQDSIKLHEDMLFKGRNRQGKKSRKNA